MKKDLLLEKRSSKENFLVMAVICWDNGIF